MGSPRGVEPLGNTLDDVAVVLRPERRVVLTGADAALGTFIGLGGGRAEARCVPRSVVVAAALELDGRPLARFEPGLFLPLLFLW